MAVLTGAQLGVAARDVERLVTTEPINYTKAQLNAAFQAIENTFESQRAAISTAINAATAPLVLTAAQKRLLVKIYLRQKFERE